MANLTDLPNIGPHAAEQLAQVGIATPDDLMAAGAEQAWLKVQAIDPGCFIIMLQSNEVHGEGFRQLELGKSENSESK